LGQEGVKTELVVDLFTKIIKVVFESLIYKKNSSNAIAGLK